MYIRRKADVSSSRKRAFAGTHQAKASSSATQGDPGFALNLAAHGSRVPSARAEVLARLPVVPVDLGSVHAVPEIFTRQSLASILGGAVQGLVVRCVSSLFHIRRSHRI